MNSASPVAAPRIESLDALRGLIMLLMALDHSADFIAGYHATEIWGIAVPVHASELGFVTRLVSHLSEASPKGFQCRPFCPRC